MHAQGSSTVIRNSSFNVFFQTTLLSFFAFAALTSASAQSTSDKDCAWLPTSKLNALMPTYGPWVVQEGGQAGLCMFGGKQVPGAMMPPTISFTQTFEASADAAAKNVKEMKVNLTSTVKITDRPHIGAQGFSNDASPDDPVGLSMWMGHRGPAVLTVSLMAVNTQDSARAVEVTLLVKAALDGSQGSAVQAAATSCPGLSEVHAKKLLTSSGYRVQRVGADSCMVSDASQSAINLVSKAHTDAQAVLAQMRQSALDFKCTVEDLPALGKGAFMDSVCDQIANGIRIEFGSATRLFEASIVFPRSTAKPTAAQKAALIEIAKAWAQR
jgi:hypothetical protein